MINVSRHEVLLSTTDHYKLARAQLAVKDFYKQKDRSQLRYSFPFEPLRHVKEALRTLFADTCAFCETSLDRAELLVDRYRPVSEAADLDGTSYPECYWRLAFNWDNLLLTCTECNHNRGNHFPIMGRRAEKISSVTTANKTERPYLLDPTIDDPLSYLRFLDSGIVEPCGQNEANQPNYQRGALTIDLFGLNRTDLVQRRKEAINRASAQLEGFSPTIIYDTETFVNLVSTVEEIVDEFSSYVAAKGHFIARYLLANQWMLDLLNRGKAKGLSKVLSTLKPFLALERKIAPTAEPPQRLSPSNLGFPQIVSYDSYYIRRIEIQNFRSIEELDLNLIPEMSQPLLAVESNPQSNLDTSRVGWKMLLGENGAGKSSVLKALALALMGDARVKAMNVDPKKILNRNSPTKSGRIKISLSKGDPIEIKFTESSVKFVSRESGATGLFVRAYGSARLFTKADSENQPPLFESESQRFDNLFSPQNLLTNPAVWLKGNLSTIDSLGLSLRDLLNLPEKVATPLTFNDEEILLDTGSGPMPLLEQSDGYKSVLAFVVDIFSGLSQKTHDKSTLGGIVLIDEIDSHLHPTWKMSIVKSLRTAFPRLQFIATTHEPLCLRGLEKGEITLLRKIEGETEIIDDLPSVADLRVDQLLTSELFGLSSTIDPAIDEKFHNYYTLLARATDSVANMPQDEWERETQRLKKELSVYNTLGFTRRDQIVYDLVDEYLAKRQRKSKRVQTQLLRETKKKIFELWDRVGVGGFEV